MKKPVIIPVNRRLMPLLAVILMLTSSGFRDAPRQPGPLQINICTTSFQSVGLPLTELGSHTYQRMDGQNTTYTGGLYPGGSNTRPPAHEQAALVASSQITPRNLNGQPDAQGKIVFVSIGMSNVNMEFGAFMNLASHDPDINPHVRFINGALPSQTAEDWIDPNAPAWQALDQQLASQQISPLQVQVAWVKQTLTRGGEFPAKILELQNDLEIIAYNLKSRFPNLAIAYYSSRIYSYTYYRGLSPEPLAFETGFAVKWMIEKQIGGDLTLNYDPTLGEVRAPVLLWGPYLWANGQTPRQDGLAWLHEDLASDCTHPSPQGQTKVANLLMDFFKTDTTSQGWFLAASSPEPTRTTPPPNSTSTPTITPSPTRTRTLTMTATRRPGSTINPTLTATRSPGGTNAPLNIFLPILFGGIVMIGGWFLLHRTR